MEGGPTYLNSPDFELNNARRAGDRIVGMRGGQTTATFTVRGLTGEGTVDVLGENRTLTAKNGVFQDRFAAWDVHLYRCRQSAAE